MAILVNDSNFEEIVLKAELPVLADFGAEWCGPCQMMSKIIEDIEKEYTGKLLVAAIDVDSCPGTAARFGIRNVPTILFFKKGDVVDKQVGATPKTSLTEKIDVLI